MAALARRSRIPAFVGAAVLSLGCTAEPLSPTMGTVNDFISGVTARSGQVVAVLNDSAPPAASFGPGAHVTGGGKIEHGGSAKIILNAAGDFTRVYVSTPVATGYWAVTLPSGVTVEDLVLNLNPKLRSGQLRVHFALEGPSGVGGAAEEVLDVGD